MLEANTFDREPESADDEDARLVEAAQKSPAEFRPIYQKWLKPVYRYFYFRVGNEEDAQDLTSQVFLKAYEDLPHYRQRGCFSAWLFAIARARVVDFYRKKKPQVPLTEARLLTDESSPMAQAIREEELHQVLELVRRLPPDQQELLRLRFVAGLNYREIGGILHRTEDAVRKAVSRVLERVQMEVDHE